MDWKFIGGKGIKKRWDYKTKISHRPCLRQESSVECCFFILGFMRDIVSNANGLDLLQNKIFYIGDDMDLIRGEWSKFGMQFIKYDM